jgi:hypothetical protein
MNQPPPAPAPIEPKHSGFAIWSLVLGTLSSLGCLFFTGLPAVICGHIGYSRINRSNGTLTGRGLALAGLITGYIGIVLSLVLIPVALAIFIPAFAKGKEMALKNACINNLLQISEAKQQWVEENKKEDTDVPTAQDLSVYATVDSLKCPAGGVYSINSAGQKPTCSIQGHVLPD